MIGYQIEISVLKVRKQILQKQGKGEKRLVYIIILLALFIGDGIIKYLVENLIDQKERIPILGGKLFLTKYHNFGAFLNLGEKKKELVKLTAAVVTLLCLLLFIVTLGRHGKRLLKWALSLLLGGAFSNMCDRLTRGYVVDYFGFRVKNKRLRNVIFNISDFGIMIGAVLLVIAAR